MILRIFFFLEDFKPGDSYKEDSYKKETVYHFPKGFLLWLLGGWMDRRGESAPVLSCSWDSVVSLLMLVGTVRWLFG